MKWLGFIAVIATTLVGCGDDTSSEARLTAAAYLFGRSFDAVFGSKTDGPLGIIFLARFTTTLSGGVLELKTRALN